MKILNFYSTRNGSRNVSMRFELGSLILIRIFPKFNSQIVSTLNTWADQIAAFNSHQPSHIDEKLKFFFGQISNSCLSHRNNDPKAASDIGMNWMEHDFIRGSKRNELKWKLHYLVSEYLKYEFHRFQFHRAFTHIHPFQHSKYFWMLELQDLYQNSITYRFEQNIRNVLNCTLEPRSQNRYWYLHKHRRIR